MIKASSQPSTNAGYIFVYNLIASVPAARAKRSDDVVINTALS